MNERADKAEKRADISEERADVSENRADASEARARKFTLKVAVALICITLGSSAAIYFVEHESKKRSDLNTCAIKLLSIKTLSNSNKILYEKYLHNYSPTTDDCKTILKDNTGE